jgi:hypothetical protein
VEETGGGRVDDGIHLGDAGARELDRLSQRSGAAGGVGRPRQELGPVEPHGGHLALAVGRLP